MVSWNKRVKTEHAGAKSRGRKSGYYGPRHKAKQFTRKLRRHLERDEIQQQLQDSQSTMNADSEWVLSVRVGEDQWQLELVFCTEAQARHHAAQLGLDPQDVRIELELVATEQPAQPRQA